MTILTSHAEIEDLGRGRFRTTLGLKPIAYERNGAMRRIGNVVAATGDPAFPMGTDELAQFRLDPRIAGKSPLLHFGKGSSFLRLALSGANNVSGQVSGNVVTFANAWNNADLTYTMGGHRLQESILLRAGHPRAFSFILSEHSSNFDPVSLSFGSDFRILQPTLDPPAGSEQMNLPLQWLVTQQGGKWVLSVTLPDGDWTGWRITG